ncbi:hypothetical protein M3P36_14300 [Altererythrobacter sp. KTW20L]|uniref:hypothetical protein n=1 Tax=Altererythrobacter sp. KTW20L TaxID=2942210 RepID=UPI0020C12FDF|nr:hypothetical protein [Altererythrobacter sp. KTW20L]MCL6252212.1 hypothetical protein [Altererythrobacter sp. KTW20L]
MEFADLLPYIGWMVAGGIGLGAAGIAASVHTTRLKIKNGYPLEGMWGQSLKPSMTSESMERVKLITQENTALRAELSSMKERLATVERIVTDSGFGLTHQIEALRDKDGVN